MIVQEAIDLLQEEDPKAELHVVRVGKSSVPRWSSVAGGMVTLRFPDIIRRVVGIESREGHVLFVQEDEAALALAER